VDDVTQPQPPLGTAYDPVRDRWRLLPDDCGLVRASSVVWTGRSVLVIGGVRPNDDVVGTPPHIVESVPR
jgi:hypothetical protein